MDVQAIGLLSRHQENSDPLSEIRPCSCLGAVIVLEDGESRINLVGLLALLKGCPRKAHPWPPAPASPPPPSALSPSSGLHAQCPARCEQRKGVLADGDPSWTAMQPVSVRVPLPVRVQEELVAPALLVRALSAPPVLASLLGAAHQDVTPMVSVLLSSGDSVPALPLQLGLLSGPPSP